MTGARGGETAKKAPWLKSRFASNRFWRQETEGTVVVQNQEPKKMGRGGGKKTNKEKFNDGPACGNGPLVNEWVKGLDPTFLRAQNRRRTPGHGRGNRAGGWTGMCKRIDGAQGRHRQIGVNGGIGRLTKKQKDPKHKQTNAEKATG